MNASDEVVVVGAGPAGAAAACLLGREGHAALLVERDTAPRHKICGEFVSVEAQTYLRELGIDLTVLGCAPIRTVRIAFGAEVIEARLPFQGAGLTRRTLDEALLSEAEKSGARLLRGEVARSIAPEGTGLTVRLTGQRAIQAKTVFLATGKHDLHAPRRPPLKNHDLTGFKMYFALAPHQRAALDDAVEIILFQGGYAGLQPVENGIVNLCLVVEAPAFEAAGKRWPALLDALCSQSAHLRSRLAGSRCLLDKPLSISHVPYGFVYRPTAQDSDGLFRLGDQMGVIPSFAGDGIAIALHSARLSAAMYCARGNVARRYHSQMREEIGRQIKLAAFLYDVSQGRLARCALLALFRLFPGVIGNLAAWTRISAPLVRAG